MSTGREEQGWSAARHFVLPLTVVGLGAFCTIVGSMELARGISVWERQRFHRAVEKTQDSITDHFNSYVTVLRAAAGMFAAKEDLSREEFRAFLNRLNLPANYVGIQGVGFSRFIRPEEREAVIASLQSQGIMIHRQGDGQESFGPWPKGLAAEEHAIIYLEPLDRRNQTAIGFNMFSEPVRREAMARARDTGKRAASGQVTLVQEIDDDKQAGFLIYVPVYRGGAVPATVDERREKLLGFVYIPFRADDLLDVILAGERYHDVDVEMFDGPREQAVIMHRSADLRLGGAPPRTPMFATTTSLDVGGRPWTIVFSTRPEFEAATHHELVPFAIAVGVSVSLLLTLMALRDARAHVRAMRDSAELEAARAGVEAAYAEKEQLLKSERAARSEVEKVNRLKDEFLATLSHELRTPLNAILGYATLLRMRKPSDEELSEGIEAIERNARVQAQLIEDLLDMNRIISGKIRLDVQPVDLKTVVDAAVGTVRPAAEAKSISIMQHHDPMADRVWGDPNRLQQVIWNLLANAIKFTPTGGKVLISLQRVGTQSVLRVQDTGQGIGPEFLPHVFERFRQADGTTTRRHGGLGLGLSIVKHLVELHGGSVAAQSAGEGKGSTFTISLPARPDVRLDDRDGDGQRASHGIDVSNVDLSGIHVLVVDDERDSCELVRRILSEHKATVLTAGSAAEGLSIFDRGQPEILISDIGMPDQDGYDFIRAVRGRGAHGEHVPAVALTAFARAEDRQRSTLAGYQVHLSKPVEAAELTAVVAGLVGRAAVK